MLDGPSLRGEVNVSQHLIEMRYGTGLCPDRAANGAELTNQDATTPGLVKAFYAEQQGRGFYDLDQPTCDQTFAPFSEALGAHLANPGRRCFNHGTHRPSRKIEDQIYRI